MIIVKKPKIRFKGFTETWEQRKLESYLQEYNEVTSINNQYPALTSSRKGLFLQTDYFSGNQVASENNIGYNIVPYGYFTYRHMSDDEVFHFNINDIVKKGIVSTLYPVFTTSKELDSKYLQYQLNYGEEFSRFARLQKQGGSRTYMYLNKLRKLTLTIPNTLDEQKKISAILLTLDHLITLHQRQCENLKKMKKFMLQKLFPQNGENVPEIRFSNFTDTWEQRKLGTVATFINGRAYSQDELQSSGKYRVLRVGNLYTNYSWYYSDMELEDKYYAISGDLLYTWSATFGPHIWLGEKIIYHYHIWKVVLSSTLDKSFAVHLLERDKQEILSDKNGSTMVHITKKGMEEKEVILPTNIDEQIKIGKQLDAINNLITLHQSKCDNLKELKKYMLQNMFI